MDFYAWLDALEYSASHGGAYQAEGYVIGYAWNFTPKAGDNLIPSATNP